MYFAPLSVPLLRARITRTCEQGHGDSHGKDVVLVIACDQRKTFEGRIAMTYREAKEQFSHATACSNDVAVQRLAAGLEQLTTVLQRDLTALKEQVEKLRRRL